MILLYSVYNAFTVDFMNLICIRLLCYKVHGDVWFTFLGFGVILSASNHTRGVCVHTFQVLHDFDCSCFFSSIEILSSPKKYIYVQLDFASGATSSCGKTIHKMMAISTHWKKYINFINLFFWVEWNHKEGIKKRKLFFIWENL